MRRSCKKSLMAAELPDAAKILNCCCKPPNCKNDLIRKEDQATSISLTDAVKKVIALTEAVAIDVDVTCVMDVIDATSDDVMDAKAADATDAEAVDADEINADVNAMRSTQTTWSCARVIKCDAKR